MADKDPFKHFPLPPQGVALMRQYQEISDSMNADLERLQTEYREKAEALHASAREQLREIWVQMATLAGVDAAESWDNDAWHVEARYVDSGFAALTFYPRPANPLAALFGGRPPQEAEEEAAEGAPKGATLN